MLFLGLDKDGHQHCWKCGGQGFTLGRTTRTTVALGIRSTFTTPKLRCVNCGEYNAVSGAVQHS